MATLQKIRSKGPLVVIVVGLALLAFLAGDAWRVFQPHQSQEIGEVNGNSLSAQDYQAMVEEYSDIIKLSSGMNSLTDEQTDQIKDEVWRSYVNNQLIEEQASKLGIKVTSAEMKAIVDEGTHQLLAQTPFRNPQTGAFDKDVLKKFLVDYSKMDRSQMPAQYVEYYDNMYKYWLFVEKQIMQSRLAEKYQALISQSLFSNPVDAQNAFDSRVNQSDLLLAAVPYSTIVDSTIVVSDADIKSLYEKKKEQYKQYVETRDIKYIDIRVTASEEDKAAVEKEVADYGLQMASVESDYAAFVRSSGSEVSYVDLFYNKNVYPRDVVSRLDSAAIGKVYGPYYNMSDNTYNAFKLIAKAAMPDSVEYRQIQVYDQDASKVSILADSIYTALKSGADFDTIAQKYGQNGSSTWLTASSYEGAPLNGDNLKFVKEILASNVDELKVVSFGQAKVILQVLSKKAVKDKFKVAVIKRTADFSKETYNKAYNDFSQFIAANPTLEDVVAHAEEAGYRLLERKDMSSSEHTVAGVRGTKDALRWIFEAKPGDVSGLYECGESDHMMVVALSAIHEEGYRPLELVRDELRRELIRDKKADKIMADLKSSGATSMAQYMSVSGAVSDTVKHVTFAAPAYVSVMRSSEPLIGAYASSAQMNQISTPLKGNSGVMVLQLIGQEKLNETFDVKSEEKTQESMYTRFASRIVNDLYLKAGVKDSRYKFF